jgi:hypothetical protein
MKIRVLAFLLFMFWTGCDFKKVTRISIENKNPYSMNITVNANNIGVAIKAIQPNEKREVEMEWTKIKHEDGQFILYVDHGQGGIDTFTHGAFFNGELSNYMDLIIENREVKINISE